MKAIGLLLLLAMVGIGMLGGGCSVSGNQGFFSEYPQQVHFGTEAAPRVYVQKPGYYAVHYAQAEDMAEEVATSAAIAVMEEESIAVFSGNPADRSPSATATTSNATTSPVYALQPNGTLAVPTGNVFIRFAETVAVESRQDAIQAAGYEIVDRPPYAPHAAWVRAKSGHIADALNHLSQLMAIPDLANVEPQMLMQRSLR